jgi:adenosylmethionine-8-amino-7-oxononanoate aminotransferase
LVGKLFGHSDPRINAALTDQIDRLPHVMLAGCAHAPAVELAERLSALTRSALAVFSMRSVAPALRRRCR